MEHHCPHHGPALSAKIPAAAALAASPASSSLLAPEANPPTLPPAPDPAAHTTSPESEKKLPYKSQTTPATKSKPRVSPDWSFPSRTNFPAAAAATLLLPLS